MILKDSFILIIHCWCFISFSVRNYRNMLEITFDLKVWHALREHIFLVCFANISGVLCWLFYIRIWINSCLWVMNSIATRLYTKMSKLIFGVEFIWKQCTLAFKNWTVIFGHMTKLCDDNVSRTDLLLPVCVWMVKLQESQQTKR